ncbi:MAG: hypothetical protein PHW82_10755 [Bacteroidales bacterium]|nr:hypothetical protein [Bacteroidales bacterium]
MVVRLALIFFFFAIGVFLDVKYIKENIAKIKDDKFYKLAFGYKRAFMSSIIYIICFSNVLILISVIDLFLDDILILVLVMLAALVLMFLLIGLIRYIIRFVIIKSL